MEQRDNLLEQLKNMLHWKKSKSFYAEKLGVTEQVVQQLFDEINQVGPDTETNRSSFEHNLNNGTAQVVVNTPDEIKTLEDLIKVCKIDTAVWNVDRYVQNYWGNKDTPYWQVKAFLSPKTENQQFTDRFEEFLTKYESRHVYIRPMRNGNTNACLLINKQDSHLNKYDIYGDNDIKARFESIESKFRNIILKATCTNNLEEIVYIVGSDEFNSEWTDMTVKGTPQRNIMDYHTAFEEICEHEVRVINEMLINSQKVIIKYIPGNHDEYVGWHLIKWLQCYYRNQENLVFETSPSYTKSHHYSNSDRKSVV